MNSITKYLALVWIGSFLLAASLFGQAGNDNPGGPTAEYHGSVTTAGYYDPYTGNAKREITDIVVQGSIGAYPLKYTRTYDTRGVAWTNNYQWGMWVRPPDEDRGNGDGLYDGPVMGIQYPNGGHFDTLVYDSPWDIDANGPQGASDKLITCSRGGCTPLSTAFYELWRADGGKVLFEAVPQKPRSYRAYAIIDPYGQTTTLTYNANDRLWKVAEPGGRYLEFLFTPFTYWYPCWGPNNTPPHWVTVDMLTGIRADDGRGNTMETVTYGYDWIPQGGDCPAPAAYFAHVYYDDGAQATYTYVETNSDDSAAVYGAITPRVLHSCDDPRYAGPMKYIEYEYVSSNEPNVDPALIARGQIKAEKNAAGQVVSRTSFPTSYTDPNLMRRTETRGDGRSRNFNYAVFGSGFWSTIWTDFKSQPFTTSYPVNFYGWITTDARGNTTTYEREAVLGAVRKITYPQTDPNQPAATKEYIFSDPQRPYYHFKEKDENGNWTQYDRDPITHQVMQIRYPDGSTEAFAYNGFGQIETHRLRTGGVENFRYDTRGLKTLSWPPATDSDPHPEQHPTVYAYYAAGEGPAAWIDRLKSVTDPRGNATWFQYNQRGQVTRVTHQDSTYTRSEYYPDGTVAWTADENHPNASWNESERTRYTYDDYKRVLTVTNPMGETTTNCYALDPDWGTLQQKPLLHTTNNPKYTLSPMGKNVVYEYDENFRKTYQGAALGTADASESRFDYDEVGNLTWTRDPRFQVTTFGYDARNRKIWMRDPMPTDRNGNDHTMDWEYNGVGNKLKETRADGVFRSWDYNSMNQLWHAYDWRTNLTPAANQTTTYNRDGAGNLHEIVDQKGASYIYFYDALGRKGSAFYPPDWQGTVRNEYFQYDIAGNLQRHDNPAGEVQWFVYDSRSRMYHSYWWGHVGPDITKGYDAASRLTSVTTNGGETNISFGYDDANRQISEEQTLAGSSTRRVETPRDRDGNRNYVNVPGWFMVRYGYTNRGQLAHIYGGNGDPWFDYSYDASGNLLKRQDVLWGVNDSLNIPAQWYDPLNRPVMWENTQAGDAFLGRSWYQFDNVGREVATTRDEQGGKGERYWYDVTNQLTAARYNADQVWGGSPVNATDAVDYGYTVDKLNRNSVTTNGTVKNYTASGLNQYTNVGGAGLGYDDRFNLASYDGLIATYNAENQLMSASKGGVTVNFTYDGLGRCVKRTVNGATTLIAYDGWKPTVEWDGAANLQAWNVYGPGADEILWRYQGGTHFRYHYDARGNVAFVLDGGGTLLERYTYDVFGKPTILSANNTQLSTSAVGNRFLFQGREWLGELGIYDYRHRMYHPELGRFLQTDPMGLQTEGEKLSAGQKALFSPGGVAPEAFASSEMNLFRYCGDDPVDGSDPLGLFEYEFSADYPQQARQMVINAINLGATTERGQQLKAMRADATITFAPTSSANPNTGAQGDVIFLNPRDSLFLDSESRRLFTTKFRNELPPENDKGRAAFIYHELGHPIDKQKDENKGGQNVRRNENPVRVGLGLNARLQYSGHPVQNKSKLPKNKDR